nr:immunoglobulin light chain junction region [Macaca mulatta]
CQKYNDSPYNF